jgi:mannose-1-phosphate guanylyltransferase
MNALVLAAGYGKRLLPITKKTPKCLVKIKNKILLQIWINKLISLGVKKILINVHYKKNKVLKFIKENKYKKNLIPLDEKKLLGTAGTLISNLKYYADQDLILIHGDNYTKDNLKKLLQYHNKKPKYCLITMLTFITDEPQTCGIIKVDKYGVVKKIYEKSKNPPGNLANGAVYIIDKKFFKTLKNKNYKDFSKEVIPKYLGKIYTCHTSKKFIDIGSPEKYIKANT